MNLQENEFPTWLQEATKLDTDASKTPEKTKQESSPDKSDMKFTDSPLRSENKEIIEVQNKPNTWIEDIYIKVWKRDYTNGLTMRELLSRFIEPESPRWYYLKAHKMHKYQVRYKCWHMIRKELYPSFSDDKYNLYGFHNAAVLTFLLGEREEAIKILSRLIELIPSPTLFLTMAYFYIETDQLRDAACVLYNLLKDTDPNLHCVFLAMKILTKKMNDVIPEPSWFERLFYTTKQQVGNLKERRDIIMPSLCLLKPNNHLFKLYLLQWRQESLELTGSLTKEEIIQQTILFLKSIIEENGSHGLKYDYIINTIVGFVLFTGITLFIKNVVLPTWRAYVRKRLQNQRNLQVVSPPKPIVPPITPKELYKFPVIKKEEDRPIDSMILRDYEYVDNLFQEIQFLSKEVMPNRKGDNVSDMITKRGFKTLEDLPSINEMETQRDTSKRKAELQPDVVFPTRESVIKQPIKQDDQPRSEPKTFGKGNKSGNARNIINKFSQFK
jgi:tetratricopeptide (TPR) repeat protein